MLRKLTKMYHDISPRKIKKEMHRHSQIESMEVSYLHKELILLNVHRHSRNCNDRPSISIQSPEIKKRRGKKGGKKETKIHLDFSRSRINCAILQRPRQNRRDSTSQYIGKDARQS